MSNRFANASEQRDVFDEGDSINVLALVKGEERYVYLFDDANRVETMRQPGRFASNTELSFTWYDSAVLSQKIRQIEADA